MKHKIDIMLATKDRPTELALLLQSLRTQDFQNFDIYICDDGSGTPITNYHFMQCLLQRLKIEGHKVLLTRNHISQGVAKTRQLLVSIVKNEGNGNLLARFDDDVIVETDYLTKMIKVIDAGYDMASGVTPPIMQPNIKREVRFVEPIINRIVLNDDGSFLINSDDCGHEYIEDKILPMDHFRSTAIYKKEIHDTISYETNLTKNGMREEEFLSLRCILGGFKLGCHTGAKILHLLTPSGGQRSGDFNKLMHQNQRMLNVWVKEMYEKHGDFIEAYHKRLGVEETKEQKMSNLKKSTNFICHKEI